MEVILLASDWFAGEIHAYELKSAMGGHVITQNLNEENAQCIVQCGKDR